MAELTELTIEIEQPVVQVGYDAPGASRRLFSGVTILTVRGNTEKVMPYVDAVRALARERGEFRTEPAAV